MKKALFSAVSFAALAGAAMAADLPSRKAPVVTAPPPMWTGFYAGLNAGGTWANSNAQTLGVGLVATNDAQFWTAPIFNNADAYSRAASASNGLNSGSNGGFIGGGQIGYNWQFTGSFVGGFEADIQGTTSQSDPRTIVTVVPTPFRDSWVGVKSGGRSLDYIGTVRGRLGWLAMPSLLLYGTGGLAYGGVTLNAASAVINTRYSPDIITNGFGVVNYSNTQIGWTAGGGGEWMFAPDWSAKVEYLYYDLGSVTQNFSMSSVANGPFTGVVISNEFAVYGGQASARLNGNIVRAGVNYHFNLGTAPVVASY